VQPITGRKEHVFIVYSHVNSVTSPALVAQGRPVVCHCSVKLNTREEKCDNSGYVSKSAMREPSNERYVVCTLYQEFT
jgi:hypothetical protein